MKPAFRTLKPVVALYTAQILNLFLGWIVTKLNISQLSVEEFGRFTFFITLINASFIFFTFGVFEASSRLLALSESRNESDRILTVSLSFALTSYFIFTLFFWLVKSSVSEIFSVDVSVLIKLYFPLAGIYLLYDFWQKILRGAGKIYRLSCYLVLPRIIYIAILIILVYTQQFTLHTTTLMNLVSFGLVLVLFLFLESFNFSRYFDSLKSLVKEIRKFGIHMYLAELIQALLFHIDKLFIAYFLTSEDLAYYSLAFTLTFPLSLFSTSLSTGMYRRFSKTSRIDDKIVKANLIWIILSLLLIIFLGPWMVKNIFSAKYMESIPVLIPLAIAFGMGGLSKIYTYFLIAKGEGKIIRNISIILIIVNIVFNILLIPLLGITGSAYARIITFILDFIFVYIGYRLVLSRVKL